MKLIHETNYKIYNQKIKEDIKISILSDLHFSYCITNEKLKRILNKIKKINPNYILFPGDLIDSTDMIIDENEKQRLLSWIKELGMIAPTIISIGGHDFYKKQIIPGTNKHRWIYKYPKELFEQISNLNNIYLLDNSSYEDNNIFVVGYTQSMEYYHPIINNTKGKLSPIKENKELMVQELKHLKTIIANIPKDKINLLLVHSPVYLTDSTILKEIENYDYYISGHMHNGCVPPILYELWNTTRGLIAPNKEAFPKNERNTLKTNHDKLIVNGPLSTFQACLGSLEKLNILFPSYLTTIEFTNDKSFDTYKIKVHKKYSK